jgi:serine protease Do
MLRTIYLTFLLSVIFSNDVLSAGFPQQQGQALFSKYKSLLLQIRIQDNAAGQKQSIGTGFLVEKAGVIVTNFHVIADVIDQPENVRASYVLENGRTGALKIIATDIVHDLALLKADINNTDFLALSEGSTEKGARIFSMGNPHDLGLAIVPGNHGGLIRDSLYEKIHFIGSVNPGMSGGPTLTETGQVVGVNVATAGNQVSFLVPVKYVKKLLSIPRVEQNLSNMVEVQLLDNQQRYMSDLIDRPLKVAKLGDYFVPDKLAHFFKCWGSASSKPKSYHVVKQNCETEDEIFLNDHHSTGAVKFKHELISSKKLGAFRFYTLFQAKFNLLTMLADGQKADVTNFNCQENFTVNNGIHMKVVFCVRRYKKYQGLYDAIVKAATVDQNTVGLQTALLLSGVSFEWAREFAQKYLASITWQPSS